MTTRWGRHAARAVATAVLAGGLVPLLSGAAWACSCEGYASDREQYAAAAGSAQVIYTGLVTAESRPTPAPQPAPGGTPVPHPGDGEVRYSIRVDESLKGDAAGDRTVSTSGSGASCGTYLETGRRALVVEYGGNRRISLCDGTTQDRVDARAAIVRESLLGSGPSMPHTGLRLPAQAAPLGLVGLALLAGARRRGFTRR